MKLLSATNKYKASDEATFLLDRYLKKELRGTLCTEAPLATSGQKLVGVFGLRFFGGPLFSDWTDLFEASKNSKLIVCGGKGGVGKTTVARRWLWPLRIKV